MFFKIYTFFIDVCAGAICILANLTRACDVRAAKRLKCEMCAHSLWILMQIHRPFVPIMMWLLAVVCSMYTNMQELREEGTTQVLSSRPKKGSFLDFASFTKVGPFLDI